MTPSDSSGRNKPAGGPETGLTGVDRLFGRDLRRRGWVLKLAPEHEPPAARLRDTDNTPDTQPDPAIIWALRWRRK